MARVGPVNVWSLGKETVDTLWRVYRDLDKERVRRKKSIPDLCAEIHASFVYTSLLCGFSSSPLLHLEAAASTHGQSRLAPFPEILQSLLHSCANKGQG